MESTPKLLGFEFQSDKADGSPDVVYLTLDFVLEKMPSIFQMLIGVGEHSLTTKSPSKSSQGFYTILKDIHISRSGFLGLISFLRLGFLQKGQLGPVMETANILGGLPELDQYIIRREKEQKELIAKKIELDSKPLPTCPDEDTKDGYCWVPVSAEQSAVAENSRLEYVSEGWSATGKLIEIDEKQFMYFRRVHI